MPGESIPQGLWLPPRVSTLLVAASDALDRTRAQADYICDGVADEVQINLALNALPAAEGRVMLSEGTFTLAAPIVIPGHNITLEGNGWSTFIDGDGLATTEHGIVISGFSYVHIKNLRIQTEDGGGKVCHCIFIEDGANEFVIDRVCIFESDSDGIHIEGTSINKGWIQDCYIEGADDNGIFVDMDAGDIIQNLVIMKNVIHSCGVDGIHFWNTGGPEETCIIEGNNIASCVGCGMYIWNGMYFTISDNILDTNGAYGLRLRELLYSNIEDNVIYRSDLSSVMLETSPNNIVEGNFCIDSQDATADGIEVDAGSPDTKLVDNYCLDSGRYGIHILGTRSSIVGNTVITSGGDGVYIRAAEIQVKSNYIYDNGQDAAGTYHGIKLDGNADKCQISDNFINSPGDSQEDGIHLEDGASDCQINNNKCYNGMGSGIALTANNDDCQIVGNYCSLNDDYGIEITAATCDKNLVRGNQLTGNITGAILDSGTLTQVEDDNEGIDVIDIKMYRRVKNTSGSQRVAGDVVIIKGIATAIEVTTTTTQGDDKVYGMIAETIANDAYGYVLVKGFTAALKVDGTVDIAIDDPLGTFTTACIAMKAAAGDQAFALALEAYTTDDSNGVIDAYIKSPWD